MASPHIKLTLFTKPECELCKPFLRIVESVITKKRWLDQIEFKTINIENNSEWNKYADKIPVLEINSVLAFKYRVNAIDLEKKLISLLIH